MTKKHHTRTNSLASGRSAGSHKVYLSRNTASLLEIVFLHTPKQDTSEHIQKLIKRELVKTFVHKKTQNTNMSPHALSRKTRREATTLNTLFAILYQDYMYTISPEQKEKIATLITTYTQRKELEKAHPLPAILQRVYEQDDCIVLQKAEDILATIQWLKKQRKLFSAVKTGKVHLYEFLE